MGNEPKAAYKFQAGEEAFMVLNLQGTKAAYKFNSIVENFSQCLVQELLENAN